MQEKFIGNEYAMGINDNVEDLKLIFDRAVSREKQLFIANTRLKITFIRTLGKETIQKAVRENFRN